jgi:hypothetical protein
VGGAVVAGDWIKMRGNLWDDPRVSRLCDITGQTEAPIIGALYWLWAAADQHTEDGAMPGLTLRQIDRKTGVQGFGAALVEVGWLRDDPQGVVIVNFTDHNGSSAKRRCTDAQRKANVRNVSASDADNERTDDGQKAPNLGAREEKSKRRDKDAPLRGAATRKCPPGFVVTPEMREWCATDVPGVDVDRETQRFMDHTFKTARSDWPGTWRNWLREAHDRLPRARDAPRKSDSLMAGNIAVAQRFLSGGTQ